jgi:hypothetical protein
MEKFDLPDINVDKKLFDQARKKILENEKKNKETSFFK